MRAKRKADYLYRLLIFSDTHYPQQDPRCIDIVKQIARDSGNGKLTLKVDEYLLNGDICQLARMSRWERDEDWAEENYSETRRSLRADLGALSQLDPHAKRIARPGNHDDNWNEYVQRMCPDVHGIEDSKGRLLTFDRWIGFDEVGWSWFGSEEPIVYYDNFLVVHGDVNGCGGLNAARKLLAHFGKSGASGHTHRPHHATSSHWPNQPIGWWVAGCMCKRTFRYLKGDARHPEWVNGFMSVVFDGRGHFWPEQHYLIEGKDRRIRALFDGRMYTSTEGV